MESEYLIDEKNRLVIKRKREKLIPRGEFQIDSKNQLIFWLNESSSWRRKFDLPKKIVFSGKWKIDQNHNLLLDITEEEKFFQKRPLVLKGEIISTNSDELAFMIKSCQENEIERIQILKLNGKWFADEHNRLNFLVEKKYSPDILIFQNIWEINSQQKLIYSYERTELKTKTKTSHTFTLDGFWQINSQNRLTYILSKGTDSFFDFRVQLESPNLYPQDGVIKYRIGIGVKQKEFRIISLYGKWQLSKKGTLLFLMDYGEGKIQKIEFGLEKKISHKDKIEFLLTNTQKQPLGITFTLTRNFLKNATSFLKLKYSKEEKRIEGGLTIPF